MKPTLFLTLPSVVLLAITGCDKKSGSGDAAPKAAATADHAEWCAEHGVPESICTRCNPKLIAEFKQKGDWCKEHSMPESQCIACDPSLKEKFEAMAPKK